jgi:hypothetical protein
MMHHRGAMWRIEYRADQTRVGAPVCPLGFMLEEHWRSGERWLGLLFRKRLTALELDHVNLKTWPELKTLEGYMKGLFEEAWDATGDDPLGSVIVAAKYPVQSALCFLPAKGEYQFKADNPVESFKSLYGYLLGLRDQLTPTLTAPVVKLPLRKKDALPAEPEKPDFELANRAA